MTRTTEAAGLSRRGFMVVSLAAAGALLRGGPAAADAPTVTVGGLEFALPSGLDHVPGDSAIGGPGWQWSGRRGAGGGAKGAVVVLARADLASSDPEEVVGWLLAGEVGGSLPGLVLQARRSRTMPGGGDQVRLDLSYAAATRARWSGTLLVATRPDGPAGALVVVGDDRLTAGEIALVLDSARWVT